MNAEEVIGSITHLLRSDYMDLLERIEKEYEEKTLSEILREQFENYGGIYDVHMLTEKEKVFLQIFNSENYFISTFGDEYCETI